MSRRIDAHHINQIKQESVRLTWIVKTIKVAATPGAYWYGPRKNGSIDSPGAYLFKWAMNAPVSSPWRDGAILKFGFAADEEREMGPTPIGMPGYLDPVFSENAEGWSH